MCFPEPKIDPKLLSEENRSRLLDWMIQVFRVLGNSSPQTFFVSCSLLDRYFTAKTQTGEHVAQDKLYLVGVAILFIASKYEDVRPISMKQAYETIGRMKFSKEQIL
jgi:Cyclin, N-terminal domain